MDDVTVRLAPALRAQLDGMRDRDRLRGLADRLPVDRGDAWLARALGEQVRDLAESGRLRMGEPAPIVFSDPVREGDSWRITATREAPTFYLDGVELRRRGRPGS